VAAVGRRCRRTIDLLTEHRPEARPASAELGRAREAEVDLQAAGKDERAIGRRSRPQVEVMERAEPVVEERRPGIDGLLQIVPGRDAEEQVDVRPPILAPLRGRPSDRPSSA